MNKETTTVGDGPFGLRSVINAAGYQTKNGAAPVDPEIVDAAVSVMSRSDETGRIKQVRMVT